MYTSRQLKTIWRTLRSSLSDKYMDDAFKLRQKYNRFRILVIGRAGAGKTTLLKRVCNTTEEPCIYDEESNNLLEPTSERGCHDINRSFVFSTNPQFIFHDSPGFESGDENQLKEVQSFIEMRAKSTDVEDQLHAIWFCFKPDKSRPLLELEQRFFNEQRAGNAPVIAIFTKFDDLIIQVFKRSLGMQGSREEAVKLLEDRFRAPLFKYKYPPKAHQNNLELSITYAIRYVSAPNLGSSIEMEKVVTACLIWFYHSYHKKNQDAGRCQLNVVQQYRHSTRFPGENSKKAFMTVKAETKLVMKDV
ncbi:hypothetical protein BYT27DRAFT_7207952 [Phlegmacium glaucopus]|nr:hypothetical protein BYT27DRAFT_7207952 [Phlegmacium glaucopus]